MKLEGRRSINMGIVLVIVLLTGLYLCHLFLLTAKAQAQVAPQPVARYQMAADSDNFYVIDQITGDVFHVAPNRSSPKLRLWRKVLNGPPR